jgi:hypothetical protein
VLMCVRAAKIRVIRDLSGSGNRQNDGTNAAACPLQHAAISALPCSGREASHQKMCIAIVVVSLLNTLF